MRRGGKEGREARGGNKINEAPRLLAGSHERDIKAVRPNSCRSCHCQCLLKYALKECRLAGITRAMWMGNQEWAPRPRNQDNFPAGQRPSCFC